MWLTVPTSCRCAPESAGSTSACDSLCQALARSATWSGKSIAPRSWRRVLSRVSWIKRLSGLTCEHSTLARGVESWMASLAAIRASRSASPGSSWARRIRDIYGPTSVASLRSACPNSVSSRTWQHTSLWDSQPSDESSKRWAIALRRDCLRRRKSARRTRESDCSFWQTAVTPDTAKSRRQVGADHREPLLPMQAEQSSTARASESKEAATSDAAKDRGFIALCEQAAMWPTIRAEDAESAGNHPNATDSLNAVAKQWPTAGANDHKDSLRIGQRRGQLDEAAESLWQTPQTMGGGSTSRSGERIDEPLIAEQARRISESSRPDPANAADGEKSSSNAPTSRPRLNPRFVEWLMNLPDGWTDFARSEMESCRYVPRMRSVLSRLVWSEERSRGVEVIETC